MNPQAILDDSFAPTWVKHQIQQQTWHKYPEPVMPPFEWAEADFGRHDELLRTPTKTIVIDLEAATNLLMKAVEARGAGYCYEAQRTNSVHGYSMQCRYYHDRERQAGCIVGTAFSLNEDLAPLVRYMDNAGRIDGGIMQDFLYRSGVTLTPKAIAFLREAQRHQDRGTPWGEAVEIAVAKVKTMGIAGD